MVPPSPMPHSSAQHSRPKWEALLPCGLKLSSEQLLPFSVPAHCLNGLWPDSPSVLPEARACPRCTHCGGPYLLPELLLWKKPPRADLDGLLLPVPTQHSAWYRKDAQGGLSRNSNTPYWPRHTIKTCAIPFFCFSISNAVQLLHKVGLELKVIVLVATH